MKDLVQRVTLLWSPWTWAHTLLVTLIAGRVLYFIVLWVFDRMRPPVWKLNDE